MMSLIFRSQLIVLGYAFMGRCGISSCDRRSGSSAAGGQTPRLTGAVTANARTFETIDYSDSGRR
jgi:hypothetical protein